MRQDEPCGKGLSKFQHGGEKKQNEESNSIDADEFIDCYWCGNVFCRLTGQHPTYLHALADLRTTPAPTSILTDQTNSVTPKRNLPFAKSTRQLPKQKMPPSRTARHIKDPEPVDVHLARADRYVQAHQLLESARRNLAGKEATPTPFSPRETPFSKLMGQFAAWKICKENTDSNPHLAITLTESPGWFGTFSFLKEEA